MPNTPVLSVTDSANGTGGQAAVAGSSPGSTNTILTMALANLAMVPGSWVSQGTITGDGTLTLTVQPGYYWVQCQSTLSGQAAVSNLVFAGFTWSDEAQITQIRAAVQASIQGMIAAGTLPGFTLPGQVLAPAVVPNPPSFDPAQLPLVLLLAGGQGFNLKENPIGPLVNARDDYGRPVGVAIVNRGGDDFVGPVPTFALQRERIIKYFISQRLLGVPNVYQCKVEPNALIEGKPAGTWNYLVSSFVLRFLTREFRGT